MSQVSTYYSTANACNRMRLNLKKLISIWLNEITCEQNTREANRGMQALSLCFHLNSLAVSHWVTFSCGSVSSLACPSLCRRHPALVLPEDQEDAPESPTRPLPCSARDGRQLVQFCGKKLEVHIGVFDDIHSLAWRTQFIAEDIVVCNPFLRWAQVPTPIKLQLDTCSAHKSCAALIIAARLLPTS